MDNKQSDTPKYAVVQTEWNEDDDLDLHQYLIKFMPDYKILTKEQILKTDPSEISVLFCDTSVIQELLKLHGKYVEYPTYPKYFDNFYNRDIRIIRAKDLMDKKIVGSYDYFVKPMANDKSFNGTLVCSDFERDYLLDQIDNPDQEIYFCKKVHFVNEYRIFVADGKCFDVADCTEELIDPTDRLAKPIAPPDDLINRLLEQLSDQNVHKFCVIDVALATGETNCWCVVEQNPPYALSSYSLSIDRYVDYCSKAWRSFWQ
jgi:hypothetical protein